MSNVETLMEESNRKLDRLLVALNVTEKLWSFTSDMRVCWLEDTGHKRIFNRQFWPRSFQADDPSLSDFSEAAALTSKMDEIYLDETGSRYAAVRTALDALQLGSVLFNTSTRFLQEAIALESLCSGSDTEITHRIATTCAILLGTGPEEREEFYKQAKRLYGIRSRIIHGTGHRAKIEELKEMEQLTRKVLRRILTEDIVGNFETSLKQRKFLLHLTLERTVSPSP